MLHLPQRGIDSQQRALCDFAYFLNRAPREITTEQVDASGGRLQRYEILEASYVVGFFNYTNRWVGVLDPKPNDGHFAHNR